MYESYRWDTFAIGETRAYAHRYRQAVITSFKSYGNARGQQWYCSTKSDPASPKHGQKCKVVWITRLAEPPRAEVAGIKPGEFDGPDAPARNGFKLPVGKNGKVIRSRPIIFDMRDIPEADLQWYLARAHRVRVSRKGWDRLHLGGCGLSCSPIGTIRQQIKLTCLPRNLFWQFELRRVASPEANDRRVWYVVTRTR